MHKQLIACFILISSGSFVTKGLAAGDIVLSTSNIHIRTLAASCAACHGSNGNAVQSNISNNSVLAGMNKSYFIAQLMAFKNGDRPATVMHRHAKGLQVEEINQLADYFSAQKPIPAISLKPQLLGVNHD